MYQSEKGDVPIIYAFFYSSIKEQSNNYRYISQKAVFIALRKTIYRLPTAIYYEILKEMEELKLIKRVNRLKIMVLSRPDCDKKIKKLKDYVFW